MQVRVGKKRSIAGAWSSSGYSLAGIVTVISLLLSGCATKKISDPTLTKAMDSLCLTGQGKGRLEYSKGRHVFNYESLWEPKETRWSLALGLPVIGQELIRFDFDKKSQKHTVSGDFALRLRKERVNQSTKGLLNKFYSKISEWLIINKERKIPRDFSGWELSLQDGDLLATGRVDSTHLFELKAFSWDKHYERMTLSLVRGIPGFKRQSILRLELFVSACNLE